jgi:hypothetical protein
MAGPDWTSPITAILSLQRLAGNVAAASALAGGSGGVDVWKLP